VSALLDGVYEPERRHLQTIQDETRLLGRIVDDLRTIALAEVGRLPLADEDVDLGAVARSTVDAFAAKAAAGRRVLGVEGTGPVIAHGDPDRLRQVLAALVDNALRHVPEGGHVTIRPLAAERRAIVEVVDDGPGLGEHPERLFDRFFRAGATPDRTSGHAGLGLAIVRALTEAQGGDVTAANRPEGGAVFRVELPAGAVR
jgi:two-component system sensor histidine kinase BaeS